jgi:hypothetical protein
MEWQAVLIITLLTLVLLIICYIYFRLRKQFSEVMLELNNQTLDYHLKKIAELGYDFTLKPGSNLKKTGKQAHKKPKQSKTFENLLE